MPNLKRPTLTRFLYPDYKIGDHTYGRPTILGRGILEIGKFCSIAEGCLILLGVDHRTDWVSTYPFPALFREAQHIPGHPKTKGPISIGNDVWVGQHVTILSGVSIGNGAVIGAMSVVSRSIAPYEIVAGNPAKHKSFRFDIPTCKMLEEKAWWNWPFEKIMANVDLLMSPPDERWRNV